jgi:hypothetical protein
MEIVVGRWVGKTVWMAAGSTNSRVGASGRRVVGTIVGEARLQPVCKLAIRTHIKTNLVFMIDSSELYCNKDGD